MDMEKFYQSIYKQRCAVPHLWPDYCPICDNALISMIPIGKIEPDALICEKHGVVWDKRGN